jgi:hypothetical protein
MSEMHVYRDGDLVVVAHSPEEAARVADGEGDTDDGEPGGSTEFRMVPDSQKFTYAETEDDEPVTHTCREWSDMANEPYVLATVEW